METVTIALPGGGAVEALRLQDLPADQVIAFMGMPSGYREQMGVKLFQLATGSDDVLWGMTFGEMEHTLNEWFMLSAESSESDEDGSGAGLNWSELLTQPE